MSKFFKKIILSGISIFALSAMPFGVDAATIKYDDSKIEKDGGIAKIPIKLDVSESEAPLAGFTLTCSTDGDLDIDCYFEQSGDAKVVPTGKKAAFASLEDEGKFPSGETNIGTLVLSNNVTSQKEVSFSVSGTGLSLSGKITLNAKFVERELSDDASLSGIKISQGKLSPEFNADTQEYTIYDIADTINSVTITPTCRTTGCTYTIRGGSSVSGNSKVSLNQGSNDVTIEVTSESEKETKNYKLIVLRGDTGYNSAKLSELSFGEYTLTPAFSKDVKEYTLTVPNDVTSLIKNMKYTLEDANAKISMDGLDNFVIGENKVTLTIDNITGSETITYIINVTRLSNQSIEILKYKNGEITFRDSEGIQTSLKEAEFKKQYSDEYEKIKDGTYKFDEDGNLITEAEKSEEETPKEEEKKDNTWLIIALIVGGLIIIGGSGFFIFRKKKPEDKEDNIDKKEEKKKNSKANDDELEKTSEIDETGIEEEAIKEESKNDENATMNIDEALIDLMSTKQYDFKDEQ